MSIPKQLVQYYVTFDSLKQGENFLYAGTIMTKISPKYAYNHVMRKRFCFVNRTKNKVLAQ